MGPIPAKWKRKKKKIRCPIKWWCQDVVQMGKWEARRFFAVRCEATDKRSGASNDARLNQAGWWWLMIRMTETLIANSLVTCYQTSKAPATTLNHGCGARPQSGLEWQLGLGSEARRVYSQRMACQLGQLWSQLCVGKQKPTWIFTLEHPIHENPLFGKRKRETDESERDQGRWKNKL